MWSWTASRKLCHWIRMDKLQNSEAVSAVTARNPSACQRSANYSYKFQMWRVSMFSVIYVLLYTMTHMRCGYCTVMAVLVGLQTTPLNYSQAFIADYTVGLTIVLLQPVFTLTVLTIALSVDSRVPRRFPYCTVLLALSTVDSRPSTPRRLAADCRLSHSLAGSHWLTLLYSLVLSLTFHSEIPVLKWARADGIVNTLCHRSYTQCADLVTGETSVVYFTWVANRYYGYEIRNQLSVEWQRHRFPGIRLHRQQRRYIRLLDSSDNLRIGSPSQYDNYYFCVRLPLDVRIKLSVRIQINVYYHFVTENSDCCCFIDWM
jgi:hypothetical protein